MWKRAGKRFSLTQGRGHDGRIREVLQESSRSSMYKVYDYVIHERKKKKLSCCELPALYSLVPDYFVHDHFYLLLTEFFLLIVYFSAGLK